ncbi:MAG: serine/threonine protein kinase [Myxococcales bacterium]|nr:serine/threonine protein kinase [Myxococcales bacterium]
MRAVPLRIDPGIQLGPFVVEHRLSQSRANTLYLARDADGGRVVLRVVSPEATTSAGRARLKREARALAGLDHPGVVRVHGVGEHEGTPWVAWAHVRGLDLERHLAERGPLPFEIAVRHAIQIADALAAAHEVGVVHRDLKPSNVVLGSDGRVVLVDFGITPRAVDARDDDEARETTGVRDTSDEASPYAAPEQLEHGLADERSDVWALGCLIFEMLVGDPPFGRGGAATAAAIPRDEPYFPSSVPAATVHIVSACLRKNSFARIATARELVALLRDALDDRHGESIPPSERISSAWPASRPGLPPSGTIPPPPRVPQMSLAMPGPRSSAGRSGRPPASATRRSARGRVKGTALRAGLSWFAELCGPTGLARVMELASPELQGILRAKDPVFGLIASGWYDTQLVGELVELLECVAAPTNRAAFASSIGDAIARENVAGVHRALFRTVSSPQALQANAQRVWRSYVDEGTLSIRLRGERAFDARVRGWSRHHPSVCRMLRAMLESSLRAVGYGGLALDRTHCVALGDTQCAFDGVWAG